MPQVGARTLPGSRPDSRAEWEWSRLDGTQIPHEFRHGRKARHIEVDNLRHILGREPEGIPTGRVPRQHDHALPRHTTQLGQPSGAVLPVVHREHSQGSVKRGVRKRQIFSHGLDSLDCTCWPLSQELPPVASQAVQ